ncbi:MULTISPECIES: maleylacetoacetate isomerase [unclassified Vibrio]|uniref:maleylacetoacetate isomerase n=1 Tax=unclassified Vibrio TaxID=2614977 RepID=UPI0013613CAD|nr:MULTISPECIES: maleylacetoacetate isomerase [unclassified Vibrio]NAW58131.1 maleylacetoacetate isomerase [Vibrio sp. V36_P2S2PM302]NAX25354.1 maleylacetoacetate isomerase [Vibrio sp. V38_P2S17PM301]NAX30608.1 maleylacetoacetate isomerase [Vibrio sp. V37_P2S8PM304]
MSERTLYGYWRSSAAYRVRIALNLKGLAYQQKSVHLVNNGGEQHSAEYQALNPSQLVPVLVDGEMVLNQSLAIIDYLDERYPDCPITPLFGEARFAAKALAQDIAIDIHPLNNLRVLQYLTNELSVEEKQKSVWIRHWIETGFRALEHKLEGRAGQYCVGDTVSLVDVCLVPQVYNAIRFGIDMTDFPLLGAIVERLNQLPAFVEAAPENQPDAQ